MGMLRMRPLEGLKALDFCWVAVGPMTTAYLAEYGATVIPIESTRRPDVLRCSPSVVRANASGYYANYYHRGLGARLRGPPRQPRRHPLQYVHAGARRPACAAAGLWGCACFAERNDGSHQLARSAADQPYDAYTDFMVPRFAVPAILAALDYRRRTVRGQHLDMSQLEVSLQFMTPSCSITPAIGENESV
jgi:crotonobetainyl-CoA:carnitine CoA-transferase CaiB-like acyl-CoA transferase